MAASAPEPRVPSASANTPRDAAPTKENTTPQAVLSAPRQTDPAETEGHAPTEKRLSPRRRGRATSHAQPPGTALSPVHAVLAELRAQMRARNALLRAEVSLGLQAKAIIRQLKDKVEFPPDFSAADFLAPQRMIRLRRFGIERIVESLVQQLAVRPWWVAYRGLADLGLAQILAVTGNLSLYANPGKVWKLFGLHVVNGKAPRAKRGEELGYARERRALMHVIGDTVIKANKKGGESPWRVLYETRKAYELARLPGEPGTKGRAGWAHRRALRYMEKRVLRDLWRAWRGTAA